MHLGRREEAQQCVNGDNRVGCNVVMLFYGAELRLRFIPHFTHERRRLYSYETTRVAQ